MAGKRFNSSKEMNKLFRTLMKRDFKGSSIGEVKRAFENALGPIPDINWKLNETWAVIRARKIDTQIEDISRPETFGSPPPIETNRGRANIVNCPVFYGTFDSRTAMYEIKVPKGTECFVSIWEFKKNTPIVSTFLSNAETKNDLSHLEPPIPTTLPSELKGGYTPKSLAMAFKLRASAFTDTNDELTSKMAHDIIYNNRAQSIGLLYPSVLDPYRNNIALNPSFVSKNMECVRVYKMIWSGAFIFRVLATGKNENGKIIWRKTGEHERDEIDIKYTGSFSPNEIHPDALKIFHDDLSKEKN